MLAYALVAAVLYAPAVFWPIAIVLAIMYVMYGIWLAYQPNDRVDDKPTHHHADDMNSIYANHCVLSPNKTDADGKPVYVPLPPPRFLRWELRYPRLRKDGSPDLRYKPVSVPIYETTAEREALEREKEVARLAEIEANTRKAAREKARLEEEVAAEVKLIEANSLKFEQEKARLAEDEVNARRAEREKVRLEQEVALEIASRNAKELEHERELTRMVEIELNARRTAREKVRLAEEVASEVDIIDQSELEVDDYLRK
jgi:hypothetical protein